MILNKLLDVLDRGYDARSDDVGFRQRIERIEALTQALEKTPDDATRADAQELVHAILELHGAGFARLLELMTSAGEPGRALLEAAARDDLVGSLLLLYGSPSRRPARPPRTGT